MTEPDPIAANDVADAVAQPPDQDEMTVGELAQAVLTRTIRPRAASVRRLAEAVLAAEEEKRQAAKKARAKKKKKAKAARKGAAKKGNAKKRKLARIPGQAKNEAA